MNKITMCPHCGATHQHLTCDIPHCEMITQIILPLPVGSRDSNNPFAICRGHYLALGAFLGREQVTRDYLNIAFPEED